MVPVQLNDFYYVLSKIVKKNWKISLYLNHRYVKCFSVFTYQLTCWNELQLGDLKYWIIVESWRSFTGEFFSPTVSRSGWIQGFNIDFPVGFFDFFFQ